jgi:hypothetical protein
VQLSKRQNLQALKPDKENLENKEVIFNRTVINILKWNKDINFTSYRSLSLSGSGYTGSVKRVSSWDSFQ